MPTTRTSLRDELEPRAQAIRDTFGLGPREEFLAGPLERLDIADAVVERLRAFNIEWHVIPPASLVPFDDAYLTTMYPLRSVDFLEPAYERPSVHDILSAAHRAIQGTIVGVETTQKPVYRQESCQQFYGTTYGLDPTCDPFAPYIQRAGLKSGPRFINSRFCHTPASLRTLGEAIHADWAEFGLIPAGYRFSICPPTAFNLIGRLFHREWSDTATLELSAHFDDHGNAIGLSVGSNQPGDFSYVRRLEMDPDLTLLGFRIALVPAGEPSRSA
jgi:hypothetical protein